jgi:hypothetical protein
MSRPHTIGFEANQAAILRRRLEANQAPPIVSRPQRAMLLGSGTVAVPTVTVNGVLSEVK